MRNRFFQLVGFDPATMKMRKEIIAGITTFLTMAYILAVHPSILAATGMDQGALFTTTAISSIVATVLMAVLAKLPFSLAPAMGLNAFFAYTIVLGMGYTWQFALTAVLIEGIIFILMSITGLREKIVEALPISLRKAIAPGIGLFIAFIGMSNAGIIVSNPSTIASLGDLHSPQVLLAIIGTLLCSILVNRKVPGSLLLGILITTFIGIPFGVTHFSGAIDVPPSIDPILFKFDFSKVFTGDMVVCVLTLFFLDMFDTVGTLIGVASRAGMLDENGKLPRMQHAFMADAVGTTVGAMLGTSTVSTFVESASGVEAGGRSGLTSLVTAGCFFLSLFFAPLFLAIPSAATAPALIWVGMNMMYGVHEIDFSDMRKSVPAFLCIALMTFSSSISDGILMGLIAYVFIEVGCGKWKDVSISSYILAIIFLLKYIFL
ncbi:MAG: NCS2 family permease [Prevotellaceae bacterium]|nr:NCS2 family permease [Candidatus Minthosoma equi]